MLKNLPNYCLYHLRTQFIVHLFNKDISYLLWKRLVLYNIVLVEYFFSHLISIVDWVLDWDWEDQANKKLHLFKSRQYFGINKVLVGYCKFTNKLKHLSGKFYNYKYDLLVNVSYEMF